MEVLTSMLKAECSALFNSSCQMDTSSSTCATVPHLAETYRSATPRITSAAVGTLVPLIRSHSERLNSSAGHGVVADVAVVIAGVLICAEQAP